MKTLQKIILFFLLALPSIGATQSKEIPFTLDDRDRIIRTEQKVEAVKTEINSRFEAVDKQFAGFRSEMNARFDQLFNFLWGIIGVFTTMMVSVFGFAFWDRKLALAPVKRENLKTLNALRDFAEHQPKLREILKNAGLM
jgi:predicted PurR-regulated permease PerM